MDYKKITRVNLHYLSKGDDIENLCFIFSMGRRGEICVRASRLTLSDTLYFNFPFSLLSVHCCQMSQDKEEFENVPYSKHLN